MEPLQPRYEGGIVAGLAGGAEDFTLMWAETLLRQIDRVQAARTDHQRLGRWFERYDETEGAPDGAELAAASRTLWAEQHTLIWMSNQLRQWSDRLHTELREAADVEARGEGQVDEAQGDENRGPVDELDTADPPWLRDLRNAVEHLNDATIVLTRTEHPAVPDTTDGADFSVTPITTSVDATPGEMPAKKKNDKNRSLRALPGSTLKLVTSDDGPLFGLIDIDDLRVQAESAVRGVQALQAEREREAMAEAEDRYWEYFRDDG